MAESQRPPEAPEQARERAARAPGAARRRGSLALDAVEINDISTAVTEACNNVVRTPTRARRARWRSSSTRPPTAWMCACATTASACGRRPPAEQSQRHRHPGHPRAERLRDFTEAAGGGTEVSMHFASPKAAALAGEASDSLEAAEEIWCSPTAAGNRLHDGRARASWPAPCSPRAGGAGGACDLSAERVAGPVRLPRRSSTIWPGRSTVGRLTLRAWRRGTRAEGDPAPAGGSSLGGIAR